ncbi:F-box/kelch-repeat protein At3g17530-like [Abrus precatorius]|uniref:F-box/kelch-repeat protein At3g17530-like n=1 Tax=Abrus precatorius TaxID=3816 RepID=A0A8B8MCQ9_ABRPR|nr:F-box/kelch-repeat protein At3g17530-like [Abrus precatorius]
MSNCFFPHEIVVEILHRLPSKSLVKCTLVCKSWRSLITDPSFISLHHRHSPSFLLLQLCNERTFPNLLHYSLHRDDPFLTHSSSLRLPTSFDREFSVVAICNGLVCITAGEAYHALIICSPSVRRFVSLPRPRDYLSFYSASVAFGFDSRNCDYKVVRIACMVDDERFGISAPEIEVYSLASGFWRNLDGVAPLCTLCFVGRDAPHGFVDGIVNWGAKRWVGGGDDGCWYYFVLSFDFEDEVFGEVVLPETFARVSSDAVTVTVVGGGNGKALTVYSVNGDSPCSCDIWVMKEYGVVESWNKVFAFNLKGFCLEAPSLGITVTGVTAPPAALCVRNSGEVLLLMDEEGKGCLYSLDLESKRFTYLQIGGDGYSWYLYSGYYSESLVLLNKASGLVSY